MIIKNPLLMHDLNNGNPIKLDLGGGANGRSGCYTLDCVDLEGVDIVADLNAPLDLLPDNSVEYIWSRHALEHVANLLVLMKEIYRICKPGAKLEIIVPHYSNPYFYSDPTHVRFFGLYSMYYFVRPERQPAFRKVPAYYTDVGFLVDSIDIQFYRITFLDRVIAPFLYRLVNINLRWQDFYERRLANLFHAWQIYFVMRPDK